MSTIHIQREHNLSPDKLHQNVDELAEELKHKLSAETRWDGDTLHFSRTGASGTIKLHPTQLDIRIKLGTLLKPLKGSVERTIHQYLDKHLA
jgi:putative polyhydroxyalkanoate system protein